MRDFDSLNLDPSIGFNQTENISIKAFPILKDANDPNFASWPPVVEITDLRLTVEYISMQDNFKDYSRPFTYKFDSALQSATFALDYYRMLVVNQSLLKTTVKDDLGVPYTVTVSAETYSIESTKEATDNRFWMNDESSLAVHRIAVIDAMRGGRGRQTL